MGQDLSKITFNEDLKEYGVTGFSRKQVELIKEYYHSIWEDNKLDLKAFSKWLKLPQDSTKEIFEFINLSESKVIDEYEFICALALFTQTPVDERIESIFTIFDNDSSKNLEKEEFLDIIKIILIIKEEEMCDNNKVKDIVNQIFDEYFIKENDGIHVEIFKRIILEKEDFKNVFIRLGIFSDTELENYYDKDLEDEINREDVKDENLNSKRIGNQNIANDNGMFENEEIDQGDQFMAVKPYEGVVKHTIPSNYKPSKIEGNCPDTNLELEYCYGYRCHDTRNNLRYTPSGNIVFHSAAICINMDKVKNKQKFNFENSDDITCFDSFEDIGVCGQMGAKPLINIWNTETLETYEILVGTLLKGIGHVTISNDGMLLAASAMNDDHNIAIYDISKIKEGEKCKLIFHNKGPKDNILNLKFNPNNKAQILAATIREFYIIEIKNSKFQMNKATWGKSTKEKGCLSIGFNKSDILIGLKTGKIGIFKGKALNKLLKDAHTKMVSAMYTKKNGIITGAADGKIIDWNSDYSKKKVIDLNQIYKSINPKIRSVCIDENEENYLIGTRGGEILEINNEKKVSVILKGHFDFELWGLVCSNFKNEFYTVGMDFLLSKWDIINRKQILSLKLQYQSKAIALSYDEKYLVVGCENGHIWILNPTDFKQLKVIKDRKKPISEIKFSPNNKYLAVGARDSKIHVYNIDNNFKRRFILKGHHSTITHFDFSENSEFIQSNCTSYEILYFSVENGKQQTKSSYFKDEQWYTWTNTFGFYVNGIWPPCSDGTDINACDRNKKKTLIATSDDFGLVKLFNYPAYKKKSSYNKYIGHSSHVTSVRFNYNDKYLMSTGGNDKSILQWKVIDENDEEEEEQSIDLGNYSEDEELDNKNYDDEEEEEIVNLKKNKNININKIQNDLFEEEDIEEGDQALAVKPFLGEMKHSTPNNLVKKKNGSKPPEENLFISHINGYRCHDTRNSAYFTNNDNKIAFISGCAGVDFNYKSNKQKFFLEHDEDLVSFAIHPNKNICATGQMAAKGRAKLIDIFVWDIETKEVLSHLKGFHLRAIKLLKFSPNGSKLLSYGEDNDNSLAVYDWENSRLICSSKVDKAKVLDTEFLDENSFISVGAKHIKIWKINGSNVNGKKVAWGSNKSSPVFSCCSLKTNYFIGTSKGDIFSIKGALGKPIKAHTGAVYVLKSNIKNNQFYSGGKDGIINLWNDKGGKIKVIHKIENSLSPGIRALDFNENNDILIGTRASELFILNNKGKLENILNGHFDGELWGLAVSKSSTNYVTCGGDKTIRLWDCINKKQLKVYSFTNDIRAVDWSEDDKVICVGDIKGKIFLFNNKLNKLDELQSSFKKKNQWIEDIKISPDNKMLAFGAHGGASKLEFMKIINNKLKKGGIFNIGLTSALIHLDWSIDSDLLMVNSQAAELKFASISSKKNVASSSTKNVEWSTWTCKFGWAVQGIFPTVDYTDINTVCRSNNQEILATGDDFQLVNLIRYPSLDKKSGFKNYRGHASHVTKVKFMLNDNRLVSTGGNDKVNIIWNTDFGDECDLIKNDDLGDNNEDNNEDNDEYIDEDNNEDNNGNDKDEEDDEVYTNKIKKKKKKFEDENFIDENINDYFKNKKGDNDLFEEEEVNEGDEFMAVKPWVGQIKPPSDYTGLPKNYDKKPEIDAELEYVYGYRAKSCRNNIFSLQSGEISYNAGALGIVLDTLSNTQTFFKNHSDDVISIAYHKEKNLIATGEIGPKPLLSIWNPENKEVIFETKGNGIIKGIECINFSPDGSKLALACIDDNHQVVIVDINSESILYSNKGDTAKILAIKWISNEEFVSIGLKHYKLWNLNSLNKQSKGKFGKANNKLVCVEYDGKKILCGSTDGNLQTWSGDSLSKQYKNHTACLDAIHVSNNYIYTGGKDKKLNILNKNYKVIRFIKLSDTLENCLNASIRAIYELENNKIIIGTFSSDIYVLTLDNQIKYKQVMTGHFARNAQWTNEVWGLDINKENNNIYTVSDDGTLREWDTENRKIIRYLNLNISKTGSILPLNKKTKDLEECSKLRSVSISPDGKNILVGCKDGTLRLVDQAKWKQIKLIKQRKSWIQEIRFSPDGNMVAVGSHERAIDIYETSKFRRIGKLLKHNSYITHLDWSIDSQFLHSNSGDYELLYWDINSFKQITRGASTFRDEEWSTWSCVLGWPVQGIFEAFWDGTDVNMVDRSNNELNGYKMIACSNDFSEIRIYRYPCLKKGSESVILKGHCSHVTNVKWSLDDKKLFSSGGEDQCIMQWNIKEIE